MVYSDWDGESKLDKLQERFWDWEQKLPARLVGDKILDDGDACWGFGLYRIEKQ